MTTVNRDELRRLHLVNALFAQITGQDLYLARQIADAIAFSLAELEDQIRDNPDSAGKYDTAFTAAAARLLETFFQGQSGHGFYHWDALSTLTSATPLFARAELMTGLKRLAPYRESTLLVTNLREALLPPEKRATERRRREYENSLEFIRDLAAARTAPNANLHLLFL